MASRRRVRLTAVRSIPVEFTAERSGEGPLTLGQLNVWAWLSDTPDDFYAVLRAALPVPEPTTVEDVANATAVLISRHESLRTTFVPGDRPRQRVAAGGVQPLEVCSLGNGSWGPPDRFRVAEALLHWLRETSSAGSCHMRIVVAVSPSCGDQVIACAAAFSHLAVDHGAIEILQRDFAGLLGDPGRRAGSPRHQPLDQAGLEATPAERRKAEAALAYLRDQMRLMPRCLYAVPGARPSGESLVVGLSSPAAALAVRRVAARTRASRSSVVLAAICAVVARRAGYRQLVFPVLSSNRFERHLENYVGTLAQSIVATIETAGRSFDELACHTWTRVMEASRHGRYDTARRDAMSSLIERERGMRFNPAPLFNSLVPESWSGLTVGVGFQPEQIDDTLARTELTWRPLPFSPTPVRFTLIQVDGCLRLDAWSGDTGLMPRTELERVLLAAERLLVAAAQRDVPAGLLPSVIDLDPLARNPDRILVDNCWIDLADVQRLLDDAAWPAVTRVFASVRGRPLAAYVTVSDDIRTPQQAHARCMAALARHPAAITPRHYLISRIAPPDPADPDAWPAPVAAGPGRVPLPARRAQPKLLLFSRYCFTHDHLLPRPTRVNLRLPCDDRCHAEQITSVRRGECRRQSARAVQGQERLVVQAPGLCDRRRGQPRVPGSRGQASG